MQKGWPYVHLVWFLSAHTVTHRFAFKIMCLNWSLQDEGTNSSLEKEEAPLSTHLCLMNWFAYKQMWWKCDSTADNGRISVTLERQYWTTCHRCCLFISSHSFNLSFVYNAWLHTLAYILQQELEEKLLHCLHYFAVMQSYFTLYRTGWRANQVRILLCLCDCTSQEAQRWISALWQVLCEHRLKRWSLPSSAV